MKNNKMLLFFGITFIIIFIKFGITSMNPNEAIIKARQNWQMAQTSFNSFNFNQAKHYLELVAEQRYERNLQFLALLELSKIYLGQEVGTTWKTRFNVDIEKAKNILDQLQFISPYSLSGDPAKIQNLIAQRDQLLLIEKDLEQQLGTQKRKYGNGENNGNNGKSQKQY